MVLIQWRLANLPWRLRESFQRKLALCTLTFRSLTYNEHMSQSYAIDFILDVCVYWFVDNFAKHLGKTFVFCVSVLTVTVVAIAYWVGLPFWYEKSPLFTCVLMLLGHWLLWNICFHYYKGVATPPGYPPVGILVEEAAGICNKCISPKPPRTHHCSVCDKCVLAMDHHCPWMNNCVGYFNRRYFYLYMLYMVLGVLFLIIFGLEIGYVVLWLNDTGGIGTDNDPQLIGHPVVLNQSGVFIPVSGIPEYDSVMLPREHDLPVPLITEAQRITANPWKRKAVVFMACTCITVFLALGALLYTHGKNISRGETSIEYHINHDLREKLGKAFRNPYDFGLMKNWKLFLGLTNGRTFFWNVIIPSGHSPRGSGLKFHMVHHNLEDWP